MTSPLRRATTCSLLALALAACPTRFDVAETDGELTATAEAASDPSSSDEGSTATSAVSTTVATGTGSGSGTSTGDDDVGSSTTGSAFDGPGCGPPPSCDRGELLGSMRIESSAQLGDIAGYTSVTGWLEIVGTDLECLDFLACLETVGHDVGIYDNALLRDVGGTDAIVAVGTSLADGSVVVARNHALGDLNGFGDLAEVPHSIVISSNDALLRISGFDDLGLVARNLSIRFNPALTDLGAFEQLAAIGELCQINNNVDLCLSETYRVCGDLKQGPQGGNTQNNDDSC